MHTTVRSAVGAPRLRRVTNLWLCQPPKLCPSVRACVRPPPGRPPPPFARASQRFACLRNVRIQLGMRRLASQPGGMGKSVRTRSGELPLRGNNHVAGNAEPPRNHCTCSPPPPPPPLWTQINVRARPERWIPACGGLCPGRGGGRGVNASLKS